MMDKAAVIAELRFCRQPVVTASSERTDFRIPISQGEIIEALARVIYVGKTSIVVRIHLYAEHPLLGDRRLCTTGYFSMVAVGAVEEPPLPVPGLLLEDDEARQEWRVGEEIHQGVVIRRRQQKASQF